MLQAQVRDEQEKHLRFFPWTIHPLSSFSLYWNTFMTVVYFVLYCEIPLRYFEILQDIPMSRMGIIVVFALSVTNLLDLVVHVLRGRISNEGNVLHVCFLLCYSSVLRLILFSFQVELSIKKNFLKYLRGFFLLDIIATVPYLTSFYGYVLQLERNWYTSRIAHHLTILRMARLHTFRRYIIEFLRYCGLSDNATALNVLIVLVVIMCHSLVTWQILPSVLQADLFSRPYNDSWIESVHLQQKDVLEQYVICLFRAIQLLMGGGFISMYSKKTTDQNFSIFIIVLGCVLRCYFMAKILEMLLRTRSHKIKHEEMMNQLSQYLTVKKFPPATRRRFKRFYQERQMGSYFREERIMACLPNKLRNEVLMHNMRQLPEKIAFLRELPTTQFEWLIQRLEQEIVLPDTDVYKFRDRGDYLWFVASGTLALYSPSDIEVCHLADGDVFGVHALVMQEDVHLMTARTLETCEIYRYVNIDYFWNHFASVWNVIGDFAKHKSCTILVCLL